MKRFLLLVFCLLGALGMYAQTPGTGGPEPTDGLAVAISTTASNPTSTSPIPFTVTFSQSVTGFLANEVTVSNGTLAGFSGSGTTYTFNVTPAASGTVTVNIAADVAQDADGNGNSAASPFSIQYTAPPVVATAQSVTVQLDATGTGTLNASSVNNGSSGGSGTLTYTIQKIARGRVPENSTLTLSTPNGANFTAIRFASYGTPSDDGNGNYRLGSCNAANSMATAQNSFVGRSTGSMDATNGSSANNNPTLGDPCSSTSKALAVQAAYSANAASLSYDCTEAGKTQYVLLTVTDGSGSTSTAVAQVTVVAPPAATITNVTPNPAVRGATVTVAGTNLSGATSLTVNGAAATISGLTSTGFTFVVPAGATNSGNLVLTLPCAQTLTRAFTAQTQTATPVLTSPANGSTVNGSPVFTGTSAANATITVYLNGTNVGSLPTGSSGNFAFQFASPFASGTYSIYVTAQVSGQVVSNASSTITFTVDTTPPTVAITSSAGASGSTTSTSPIPFTVTFSESVTGFVQADLTVTGGSISGFSGSGTTYTFNVTPASSGTVTVNVPANVAQDAAGNGNTAASPFSIQYAGTPVLTTVAPAPGGLGQSITLTGTGLSNPTALTINGANALANIISNSGTSLVVRVPVTATASGSITLTTANGASNALPFTVMAAPGNALAFDGANDYVSLPAGLTASATDFTFEAWVKYDGTSGAWNRVFDFGNDATVNMFLTPRNGANNTIRFAITQGGAGGEQQVNTNTVMPADTWHHVALTLRQTGSAVTGSLYLDGAVIGTNASMTLTPASLGSLSNNWLGRSQYNDPYFNGRLDEVRVWNVARTQAEVQADMRNVPTLPATGLLAYYNFDQGTPATASTGANAGLTTLYDLVSAQPATLNNFALSSGNTTSNYVESYAMVVPTATAATTRTGTGFTATWTAPAVGIVESYRLDVATDAAFTAPVSGSPFTVSATATSYALTGLNTCTTYYYRVRADKASVTGQGAPSNTVSAQPDNVAPNASNSPLPAAPALAASNVPEASSYGVLYQLDMPANGNFGSLPAVPYTVDNSAVQLAKPARVAYFMELTDGVGTKWVWASMDNFAANLTQLGLPHYQANPVNWHQSVTNLNVFSNNGGSLVTGSSLGTGRVEMWTGNYTAANPDNVPGASASLYDFGDAGGTGNGYGSFQVHNLAARQTVFAYNAWHKTDADDVGIGNQASGNPDWTFARNVGNYTVKRLYILVPNEGGFTQPAAVTLDVNGMATLATSQVYTGATDNCTPAASLNVVVTPNTFTCDQAGTTQTVTVAVSDASGNTTTQTALVTVTAPPTTTTTWDGSASTDWNDCANWSYGKVPDATTNAVIPVGLLQYPVLNTGTVAVKDLTIKANITLASAATIQVNGNFSYDGTASPEGTIAFVGRTTTQTLSSTTALTNLTVNKTAGAVRLQRDLAISGLLEFSAGPTSIGLLNTASFRVNLEATASLSETETSYVVGKIAAPRTLAAGTAQSFGGLGLTLTPAAGSTAPGLTQVVRTTGTALTGIGGSVSILRNFDIQPAVRTGLNVDMDFQYFDHELNNIQEANLALFKSETGAPSTWSNQSPFALNTGTNTVSKTGITSFSIWTLGNALAPLPVQLTSFTAKAEDRRAVRLAWTTAAEVNSAYFEVERSLDGASFTTVGKVAAAGTSTTSHTYGLLDAQLPTGTNLFYYRLRQVDLDGTAHYSQVRVVALTEALQLTIYPNPTHQTAATLVGAKPGAAVQVFDAVGRLVLTATADATGTAVLPVDAQPMGVYVVRSGSQVTRLVVEE